MPPMRLSCSLTRRRSSMAKLRYSAISSFVHLPSGWISLIRPARRAHDRLAIALLDVAAEGEVAVVGVGVVPAAQLRVEDLGDVIGDEAHVGREIPRLHLRHLPAGQVGVPAVVERHVVADRVRERAKRWLTRARGLDVAVQVAVENDAAFAVIVPLSSPRENEPCSM